MVRALVVDTPARLALRWTPMFRTRHHARHHHHTGHGLVRLAEFRVI